MTKIIAFAGRKQSGKTTSSDFVARTFISNMYGEKAKVYNFADPLKKDICMNILGLTHDQCYGSDDHKNTLTNCIWENKRLTAREVMQFVGTDLFRKLKNDVWVEATINKIFREKQNLAIISDCRFPNEVQAVKKVGGYIIKLTRDPYHSDHESEMALDEENYDQTNFDLIIDNRSISINDQNQMIYDFLIKKGLIQL